MWITNVGTVRIVAPTFTQLLMQMEKYLQKEVDTIQLC